MVLFLADLSVSFDLGLIYDKYFEIVVIKMSRLRFFRQHKCTVLVGTWVTFGSQITDEVRLKPTINYLLGL